MVRPSLSQEKIKLAVLIVLTIPKDTSTFWRTSVIWKTNSGIWNFIRDLLRNYLGNLSRICSVSFLGFSTEVISKILASILHWIYTAIRSYFLKFFRNFSQILFSDFSRSSCLNWSKIFFLGGLPEFFFSGFHQEFLPRLHTEVVFRICCQSSSGDFPVFFSEFLIVVPEISTRAPLRISAGIFHGVAVGVYYLRFF